MVPKNILKEDILQAYDELGGIEYLRRNPELLQRILLKIVNAPTQEAKTRTVIDLPWLDWGSRLSYREQRASRLPDIEDIEVIRSWKDGERPADPGTQEFLEGLK